MKMEFTPRKPAAPDVRGFFNSRQAALAAAFACALVAAGIFVYAINHYRHSATSADAQSTVYVAKNLIQKGTAGNAVAGQGLATSTGILQKQVTAGAIADTTVIRGKVAVRDILPGEQLTLADFAVGSGVAASLAPNQRAMSVSLDQSHGLLGVAQAGDHVDVYGGFNVDQGSKPRPVMRLLIPNVQVLQAAGGSGGIGGGGGQSASVVLAVNDAQAGMVAFAADNGKIWLVLRPGSGSTTPPTFNDLGSVLLGSTPIQGAGLDRAIQALVAKAQ
jgi:Flp pilus assembly protein CpaB